MVISPAVAVGIEVGGSVAMEAVPVGLGCVVAGGGVVVTGPIVGRGVAAAVGDAKGVGVAGGAVGVAFEHAPVSAMIRTTAGPAEAQNR